MEEARSQGVARRSGSSRSVVGVARVGTNLTGFWNSNTVWIPLSDGAVQRTTYNNNLHPWRQQFLPSVRQWGLDASLFKIVPIGERVKLRFNADF